MEYRREIDGLRAVAVLPVILFHAGVSWVGGGYVGVDVFFVISGYLITSLILAERAAGTFTLTGFYERRARRILPPLLLVLLACIVFGWFYMLPNQLEELSRALIAVPIFASNILFSREADYFARPAEFNPLLHTWSLAVEEQFYVIFPLVIALFWRTKRRWLIGFLGVLVTCLISFRYAESRSFTKPEITFYLLKARAWELLAGGLIAFYCSGCRDVAASSNRQRAFHEVAAVLGLALIGYAAVMFDRGTRFPSIYTGVPVAGAALVILFATPKTLVGRFLSLRWLVGLGLISYSAYLWHQPMFASARLVGMGSDRIIGALAVLSILVAYVTWRYVELPFRNRRNFSRSAIAGMALTVSATVLCLGIAFHANHGYPERVSKEQLEVLAYRNYDSNEIYRYGKCLLKTDQPVAEFSSECDATAGSASEKLFLWGDSFAAHLYPGLKDRLRVSLEQYSSVCPPLVGIKFDYGRDCAQVEKVILEKIRVSQPRKIVLAANWRKHAKYLANVGPTIDQLHAISSRSDIVIVGNVPQWEPSLPEIMARARRSLQKELHIETPLLKELRASDELVRAAAASRNVDFVSPLEVLCGTYECRATVSTSAGVEPMAYDYGHLTKEASSLVVGKLGFMR